MVSFKEFASAGQYIKLDDIGDSVTVLVAKDPFTLKPRESQFKDVNGDPKVVFDYVFTDPVTKKEKIFSNGSQSFARAMAKLLVGDTVKIIKIEKNSKPAYTVKKVDSTGKSIIDDDPEEINTEEIPF